MQELGLTSPWYALLLMSSVLLLGLRCDLGERGMRRWQGGWVTPLGLGLVRIRGERSGLREAAVVKGTQSDQGTETDMLLMALVTPQA